MSLILRVKGANYTGSTAPKLVPYRFGFPKSTMRALYLCEEGTNGDVHVSSLVDSSGNGNHAPIKAGWSQPTKRAYGFECAAGGLVALPPFTFGSKWTAVVAAAFNTPTPASTWYGTYLSRAASVPANTGTGVNSDQASGGDRTFLNAQAGTDNVASIGIYNSVGFGSAGIRPQLGGNAVGRMNASAVMGLSYDSTTGLMTARLGSSSFSVTQTGRWTPEDAVAFGLIIFNTPIVAGAKLHLAGFWSDVSSDGVDLRDACIDGATKRLTARGVTLLTA